jgi:hypothetical protein
MNGSGCRNSQILQRMSVPEPFRCPKRCSNGVGGRFQRLDSARAGAVLGPFDVARSSERTDEQELRMHGETETEGCSQGNRAEGRGEWRGEKRHQTKTLIAADHRSC